MKQIKTQIELTDFLVKKIGMRHMTAMEKLVLCVISGYTNPEHDWKCWPSLECLQEKCCATRPTIIKATKGLKDKGVLEWVKGRTNIANKYFIDVRAVGRLIGEDVRYAPIQDDLSEHPF